MNYIIVPRQLIYNTEISKRRIIVYSYLCCKRALDDSVGFSISNMVRWSCLNPDYRENRVNDKYIKLLKYLSENDYFEKYPDFSKFIKSQQDSERYYELQLNREKFDVGDNFAIIYFDELEKIINFKRELVHSGINLARMSAANILLLLSYIRVNMNYKIGQPLCCYRLNKTISDDIGISECYIARIIEILDAMDIIKYQDSKRKKYEHNGKTIYITTPKVFADYRKFNKNDSVNQTIDVDYDYKKEISKQIQIMNNS